MKEVVRSCSPLPGLGIRSGQSVSRLALCPFHSTWLLAHSDGRCIGRMRRWRRWKRHISIEDLIKFRIEPISRELRKGELKHWVCGHGRVAVQGRKIGKVKNVGVRGRRFLWCTKESS